MLWVGLTGGIGCGKSTVSRGLAAKGLPIVDADEIAKSVVLPGTPGLNAVVQAFGPDVLTPEGKLDRRRLGQKVFGHPEELNKLESILHPLIRAETQRQRQFYQDQKAPVAIYDIPLLFETGSESQFDKIIVISCTREQQKERLRRKFSWSEEEIEMRLASQLPLAVKELKADFVLHNNRDEQNLLQEIQRLYEWLDYGRDCF